MTGLTDPLERPARTSGIRPIARPGLASGAAASRLIDALVQHGVEQFFGIPGGPAAPIFEAIRMHSGADLVESRHETAAAFAAAGYHRATGRVAGLVLTAGPGITNAVTGIASAHLEGVPLMVLAGDVAWATRGGRLAQDSGPEGIATEAVLGPFCRATVRAANPASLATQGLAALRAALDALRPGPALLVVPMDHAAAPASEARAELSHVRVQAPARQEQVEQAAHWLQEAHRPLVIIGGACRRHVGGLRRAIEQLELPFLTTPRAKGLISETHPLSLRNGGMSASHWARRFTAKPIDVALALGTDLDDTSVGPTRYVGPETRLIHVDLDPTVFRRNFPTALPIHADLGAFLQQLNELSARHGWANPRGRRLVRAIQRSSPFDVPEFRDDERTPVAPHRVLADLEASLDATDVFITDIGEHMLFCLHYLTATSTDRFHIQLNLGSMGSGIGGAIGLALGQRNRRVVCVCGDGGLQMSSMEMLVAVQRRLPILYVVFNDSRYNMVHHGMKQLFGAASAWEMPPVDFAAWARSLGVASHTIVGPGQITRALIDGLMGKTGPALLDVRIDRDIRIRGGGRVEALQHMSMLGTMTEDT